MNKKGIAPIFIIGIVVVSALIFYTSYDSLETGSVVTLEGGFSCYDSDSGINTGVKGYTQLSKPSENYKGDKIYDYCADSKTLVESGCKRKEILTCPYGCVDGKCAENPNNIKKCPSGTTEFYCNGLGGISKCDANSGITTTYACSQGMTCSNGKCIKTDSSTTTTGSSSGKEVPNTESCTDSDLKKDIYVKGTTTGKYANGNSYSYTDYCSVTDKSKVSESFCVDLGNNIYRTSSEWISCPLGYLCQDGACVKQDDVKTCVQNGGKCRNICNLGEINIGLLDCGGNLCCKEGEIGECAVGTTTPYCSKDNPEEAFYYKCSGGVTVQYSCRDGFVCSDGDDCFRNGLFPSGDTFGDVVGQVSKSVVGDTFRGIFGDSYKIIIVIVLIVLGILALLFLVPYVMILLQTIRGMIPK